MDVCIDEKDEERENWAQPACQPANKLNDMAYSYICYRCEKYENKTKLELD